MKTVLYALFAVLIFTNTAMTQNKPQHRSMSGTDIQIVLIALPEFARQSIDIKTYDIIVSEDDNVYTVSSVDLTKPEGYMGSQPGRPELTVEISKTDRKIVRSYFNR